MENQDKHTEERVLKAKSGWAMLICSILLIAIGILLCVFSDVVGADTTLIIMIVLGVVFIVIYKV